MPAWMALWLTFPLAFAQSTVANAQKETGKIYLEGRILSTSGGPVRKASVRLEGTAVHSGQPPVTYTDIADSDGRFVFDDVPPGRYTLTAEKAGFVRGRYGARTPSSPPTPLDVAAGEKIKDLVLQLTPHGVISGKVLDQDGDPLAYAQITVMRSGYDQGRRQLLPAGGALTDDQGNFRVANLTPGRYVLSAQDRRSITVGTEERPGRSGAGTEGYVITYYPGVADVSSASPIDVGAGAELSGISIQLRKSRVYAIRGKAVDTATGVPPRNLPIMALPRDSNCASVTMLMSRSMQQIRADGSFEIRNLPPDVYVLQNVTAFSSSGAAIPVTGRLEVTVDGGDVDGVTFALGPGAEITGSMSFDGGDLKSLLTSQGDPTSDAAGVARIAAKAANVSASGLRPRVGLISADGCLRGTLNGQVKDDGSFQIKGIPASRFIVNFEGLPEGTYVKAGRFGKVDVTREALDLTAGTGGALEVVLSLGAADVSGLLRGSKGETMSGISVTLWPKDLSAASPWIRVRSTATDQTGGFKFVGLAPGDYYVAAWEDAESGLLQNADFLARFINYAVAVKVAESSRETVDLKLIPYAKISAEVAKIQ